MSAETEAPRTTLSTVAVALVAAVVATSLAWGVLATRSSEVVSDLPGSDDAAGGPDDAAGAGMATVAPPPDARAFPGLSSATDADLGDSIWFVLDRRGRRVHRFDESGALLGSFARQGEGPGELSFPSAIAVHRDTVVVADGLAVRLYGPSGAHIADRRVSFDGCLGPRIADIDSSAGGLLFLVHCANPAQGDAVFLTTEDGRARRLAATSPEGRGNVLSFASTPVVSAHSEGFLFGDASSDCLDLFDGGGAPKRRFCHDWMPRPPLSEQERDDMEDELRGLAASAGLRLDVPASLPPFDRVFTLKGGRLAYRALVRDSNGEVTMFRLVVQGEAGDALALPVPAASAVFASGESALAAWEAMDAMHVAVYSLRDF